MCSKEELLRQLMEDGIGFDRRRGRGGAGVRKAGEFEEAVEEGKWEKKESPAE